MDFKLKMVFEEALKTSQADERKLLDENKKAILATFGNLKDKFDVILISLKPGSVANKNCSNRETENQIDDVTELNIINDLVKKDSFQGKLATELSAVKDTTDTNWPKGTDISVNGIVDVESKFKRLSDEVFVPSRHLNIFSQCEFVIKVSVTDIRTRDL